MSVVKQMIPRELLEFQQELMKHPKLADQIRAEAQTFEEGLAMACTYVGVVVDGYYDVDKICGMLTKKLLACRHIIVVEEAPDVKGLVQDAPVVSDDPDATTPSGLVLPVRMQ